MPQIPDFSETECWTLQTTLDERWGKESVELQLADAEIRLDPDDRELSVCPTAVWNVDGCGFALFKTGDKQYRCQFFYRGYQQYGTGIDEYNDIGECAVSLLQAQADHQSEQ